MVNTSSVQSIYPSRATGWHGDLRLRFGRDRTGITQLTHAHVQAPLKIQRPFHPEGNVCHGVMLHTAGGIVGGDRLSTTVQLDNNSHALLTTAAASKVYGSSGITSDHHIHLQLAAGACLEWFPQGTIVFHGARFQQRLRVDLAEGATWLGWDIQRFGRTARSERFTEGDWRSHTEVWQNGRPVWIDPQWLPGQVELLDSPHGLAGQPVVGSFILMGQAFEAEVLSTVRSLEIESPHAQDERVITPLPLGLLCRYRGPSTQTARRWFIEVWRKIRPLWCDRPVHIPRVWP